MFKGGRCSYGDCRDLARKKFMLQKRQLLSICADRVNIAELAELYRVHQAQIFKLELDLHTRHLRRDEKR